MLRSRLFQAERSYLGNRELASGKELGSEAVTHELGVYTSPLKKIISESGVGLDEYE